MMSLQAASAAIVVGILASSGHAGEPLLQNGSYEVTFRLELPHLESWAIAKTATICVSEADGAGGVPFPVLSGNNPFGECWVRNVRRDGASLRYDIACAGRDAARARAAYTLTPRGFTGRIAMIMGAKNMTMTEVQAGRRVGSCDLAGIRRD